MSEVFTNRKQREPQAKNKEGKACYNEKAAEDERQNSMNGLPDNEQLKDRDDHDDRHHVAEAEKRVF
jgi:hypothetical protein